LIGGFKTAIDMFGDGSDGAASLSTSVLLVTLPEQITYFPQSEAVELAVFATFSPFSFKKDAGS